MGTAIAVYSVSSRSIDGYHALPFLMPFIKSLPKIMENRTSDVGFGKIHNTLATVMHQYKDIEDFLSQLDSDSYSFEFLEAADSPLSGLVDALPSDHALYS